jgi:hypothetical protein
LFVEASPQKGLAFLCETISAQFNSLPRRNTSMLPTTAYTLERSDPMIRTILSLCFLVCAHGAVADQLPEGEYGGRGAKVVVEGAYMSMELDCGHGEFPRPNLDEQGNFQVEGYLQSEIVNREENPKIPTQLEGTYKEGKIKISVQPSDREAGPFVITVEADQAAALFKCR